MDPSYDSVEHVACCHELYTLFESTNVDNGRECVACDAFLHMFRSQREFNQPIHKSIVKSMLKNRLLPERLFDSLHYSHQLRLMRVLRVLTRDRWTQRQISSNKNGIFSSCCSLFTRVAAKCAHETTITNHTHHLVELCSEIGVMLRRIFDALNNNGELDNIPLILFVEHRCVQACHLMLTCSDPILVSTSLAILTAAAKTTCFQALAARDSRDTNDLVEVLVKIVEGSHYPWSPPAADAPPHVALQIASSPALPSTPARYSSQPTPGSFNVTADLPALAAKLLDIMTEHIPSARAHMRSAGGGTTRLAHVCRDRVNDAVTLASCARIIEHVARDTSMATVRSTIASEVLLSLMECESPRLHVDCLQALAGALLALSEDEDCTFNLRRNGCLSVIMLHVIDAVMIENDQTSVYRNLAIECTRLLKNVLSHDRRSRALQRTFSGTMNAMLINRDSSNVQSAADFVDAVAALSRNDLTKLRQAIAILDEVSARTTRIVSDLLVHEELGRGAFGVVYRCSETSSVDQPQSIVKHYALKAIPITEETDANAIVDEVSILSALDHPNIVQYHRSWVEGQHLYIQMEMVDGVSLKEYIDMFTRRGEWIPEQDIWGIFAQICLALCYLHLDKHVIHRDLTPNNVMVDTRLRVKLTDMGLARFTSKSTDNHRPNYDDNSHSNHRSVVGTVSYAAPEMIQRMPYTDRADMWSLGCLLYAIAAGRPAFTGDNPLTLAQKIVHASYAPLADRFSSLMYAMVARLLTVNQEARPDIVQLASMMGPLLMTDLDRLQHRMLVSEAQRDEERVVRLRTEAELARERQHWKKLTLSTNNKHLQVQSPQQTAHAPTPQATTRFHSGSGNSPTLAIDATDIFHKLSYAQRFARHQCSPQLLQYLDSILGASYTLPALRTELSALVSAAQTGPGQHHRISRLSLASTQPLCQSQSISISASGSSTPNVFDHQSGPTSMSNSPRTGPMMSPQHTSNNSTYEQAMKTLTAVEDALVAVGYYSDNPSSSHSFSSSTAQSTIQAQLPIFHATSPFSSPFGNSASIQPPMSPWNQNQPSNHFNNPTAASTQPSVSPWNQPSNPFTNPTAASAQPSVNQPSNPFNNPSSALRSDNHQMNNQPSNPFNNPNSALRSSTSRVLFTAPQGQRRQSQSQQIGGDQFQG